MPVYAEQADAEEEVYTSIPSLDYSRAAAGPNRTGSMFNAGRPGVLAYLGTFVNDSENEMIAEFYLKNDGPDAPCFLISPKELREIGLVGTAAALNADGYIDIARLPNVTFAYDEEAQTIRFFTADNSALVPNIISMSAGQRYFSNGRFVMDEEDGDNLPRTDTGGLVNYTLYADSGSRHFSNMWGLPGLASQFEGRLFSKYGTITSNEIVRFAEGAYRDSVRLDTNYNYWDEKRLTSITAGDFINRGLNWTRPVRMGGFQWRRNFAIRSDLVTMPLPSFSGSAAVPSSMDVYINNLRRSSTEVPVGPWRINDVPVVTGANEARVVVKDALGRETVTEVPFYASLDMLAKGLSDFSVEGGFLRYNFGTRSHDYSHDFAASGTVRYGLADHLTVEGHGEYTRDFYNGGAGAVFNLGALGVASVSGAGSTWRGKSGTQAAVAVEMERWGMRFYARSERTFGRYYDLASATTRRSNFRAFRPPPYGDDDWEYRYENNRPIKSLDQVSLGVPLQFDPTTLNISYTAGDYYGGYKTQFVSFSASRSFGRRIYGYASAYKDLKEDRHYGVYAGLSVTFNNNVQASGNVLHDRHGTSYQTEISRYDTQEIGSAGWRLRAVEGAREEHSAYGSYRARMARLAGSVEQVRNYSRVTAEVEGAIVVAGGGIFGSNRIEDSFAIVDVGAPNVPVLRENRPYGKTGRSGRLIVPDLPSYQPAKISIDAEHMPLNAFATEVDKRVTPAYRGGVVTRFTVEDTGRNALLTVVDASGAPLELGSLVEDEKGSQLATIGYDGQAFLPLAGYTLPAQFMVKRAYGGLCRLVLPRNIALGGLSGATQIHCTDL
ncbi:MAG: Putative outer membrane usher protein YehB [Candidatus Tokpelaia hoelldobleri]|uniref:Outer membrane usher protein YehB n=1 Tax=Candidatus Tokpelaia hoelldobleri TaxID=1902579 RepID=A0A1U9JVJ5_9HYPH|nr:MAG: Putative outer membrane usher protein YehB [Candidatus Tokpelaia hoelldoblerii]